jgi:diguanylate cyclase (GGDEF)-like protein/PAS domain S-box-containing protein
MIEKRGASYPVRALLVTGREDDIAPLIRELCRGGFEPDYQWVSSPESLSAALTQRQWDVVICRHDGNPEQSLASLQLVKHRGDLPFILTGDDPGTEAAVALLKAGADDFVIGESLDRLPGAVDRELQAVDQRSARELVAQASVPEESGQQWRELFDHAHDVVATIDMDGTILALNKPGRRILGYAEDEVITDRLQDVLAPQEFQKALQMIQAKLDGEPSTIYELSMTEQDGRIVPMEITSQLMYRDGEVTGIQAIARDLTERRSTEAVLQASEARYRDLFENAHDMIFTIDLQGNFTSINKMMERVSGYSREEALHLNLSQALTPESLEVAQRMIYEKLTGAPSTLYEVDAIAKDGHIVHAEISSRLLYEGDKPVGVQGIARDLTERRRNEEALRASEERYRMLVATSEDIISLLAPDGTIRMISARGVQAHGYESAEPLIGANILDLVIPEDRTRATQDFQSTLQTGRSRNLQYHFLKRNGGTFPAEINCTLVKDSAGTPESLVAIIRDVTEHIELEEHLQQRALHDALTGLPNRVLFADRLDHAILTAQRDEKSGEPTSRSSVAVLLMDLDNFKAVNDTLGHAVGDQVLRDVGPRLQHILRQSDTIARWGGDEFVFLLPSTNQQGALQTAGKIVAALRQQVEDGGSRVEVEASVGIAIFPEHGRHAQTLILRADRAMYAAKRARSGYSVVGLEE